MFASVCLCLCYLHVLNHINEGNGTKERRVILCFVIRHTAISEDMRITVHRFLYYCEMWFQL